MTRPLPRDTRDIVKGAGTPSNFALAFHRYLDYPGTEDDLQNWTGAETEETLWKKLEACAHKIFSRDGDRSTQAALDQQHARYDHILDLRRQRWGPGAGCKIKAKVAWRLLIGLSAPSVLNNGITLHPLFGFPYLPASGLKGLVRHFRLTEIAEKVGVRPLSPKAIAARHKKRTPWQQLDGLLLMPEPETSKEQEDMADAFEHLREDTERVVECLHKEREDEERQEDEAFEGVTCELGDLRELATGYRRAFGSPSQRGCVNFFDALPAELVVNGTSLLERDVVTPHNKPYHTEGDPPADYHDPVPVQMLAVRRGASFIFRLTCPDKCLPDECLPDECLPDECLPDECLPDECLPDECLLGECLLGEVRGWLERAIEFWGAGAKTRAGYGELIAEEPAAA